MARRSITLMDPRRLFRDDMWDNFMNDGFGALSVSQYGVDMYETDNKVVVEIEAPKFTPENVDISIEDQTLTISGHMKKETEEGEEGKKYHYREISSQSFTRAIPLPVRVKAEESEAEFNEGIIKITLPKAEEVKPKKIAIKTKDE